MLSVTRESNLTNHEYIGSPRQFQNLKMLPSLLREKTKECLNKYFLDFTSTKNRWR